MPLTPLDIYDAYPNSDLLPIERPVGLDLDQIEEMADDIGDTLFLFLCRELCSDSDEISTNEAHGRMQRAILDIETIMRMLESKPDYDDGEPEGTPEMQRHDDACLGRLDVAERVVKGQQ